MIVVLIYEFEYYYYFFVRLVEERARIAGLSKQTMDNSLQLNTEQKTDIFFECLYAKVCNWNQTSDEEKKTQKNAGKEREREREKMLYDMSFG